VLNAMRPPLTSAFLLIQFATQASTVTQLEGVLRLKHGLEQQRRAVFVRWKEPVILMSQGRVRDAVKVAHSRAMMMCHAVT